MAIARAEVRIRIERPVSEVFDYITHYGNNVRWQDGVKRSEQVTPGEPAVGAKVRYSREVMGRELNTEATIVRLEPSAAVRIESSSRLYTYEGGYDFSGDESHTWVHYRGEIRTGALLGVLGRVLVNKFEGQMRGDLARLKGLLEGGRG